MGMKLQDDMRDALQLAAKAMSRAILQLRQLGQDEAADRLTHQRDEWVRQAERAIADAGPRGRLAVPPIVPAHYSLKPPARARPPVHIPPLRLVEVEPFHATIERMQSESERLTAERRAYLQSAQELPDAG